MECSNLANFRAYLMKFGRVKRLSFINWNSVTLQASTHQAIITYNFNNSKILDYISETNYSVEFFPICNDSNDYLHISVTNISTAANFITVKLWTSLSGATSTKYTNCTVCYI